MHDASFVKDIAVVLGVAAATGIIARLLRQPTILGYLFAGLVVGPYIPIPVFADAGRVEALAEFGVVLVMFAVGLEFRIARLVRVLPASGFTGLVQVSFLMWSGFSLGQLLGWSGVESAFLGACIAISSTMVVSKVLEQTPVASDIRHHVFGVLVIQDVFAIVLIAAMTAVASGSGAGARALAVTMVQLGGALLAMLVGGLLIVPRLVRFVRELASAEILVVVAMGLCFGLALLAEGLGYSVALGAFVAGILVAESRRGHPVEQLIQPLRDVFAAIFFVSIGMTVDPRRAWDELPVSLLVFVVVVTAQLASVTIAGLISGNSLRRSLVAGLALGQIGEFAFILAAIGTGSGAVRSSLQPVVVTVAVLTAFTTPLSLRFAERAVELVDRALPRRVRHLLELYQSWFAQLRRRPDAAGGRGPIRRNVQAIAIDALVLFGLAAIAAAWLPELARPLRESLGVPHSRAQLATGLLLALASAPFLIGLVRSTLSLSHAAGAAIAGQVGSRTQGGRIAARALAMAIRVLVALGVGLPAAALISLTLGGLPAAALLALLVLGIGLQVWSNATAIEGEYRSGAERMATLLAADHVEEEPASLGDPSLIPGLDAARAVHIEAGSQACGRSLKQLNLRALTGVTVVAIQRAGQQLVLPTGRERLEEGDMLAMIGAAASLAAAEALLNRESVADG